LAAYRENIPTDALISDTIILVPRDDLNEPVRWAAAAVLGFSRGGYYLDTARSLMEQVMKDATEISWRMQAFALAFDEVSRGGWPPAAWQEARLTAAANLKTGAQNLSVYAEILWHFYAVSLQHAWYFMENSAKAIDPTFARTTDEAAYVDLIQAFRNHMEHRDKATRDIDSHDWRSMSRGEQHTVTVGYRRDQENSILFVPVEKGPLVGKEQKMPMNPAGFERFETMLISAYERLRRTCLEQLEQHFLAHPDLLPPLDQVGRTLSDSMEPVEGLDA